MVSASLTLIVDDQDPRIIYHCPVTKEAVKGPSYFHNTWTTIDSLSCGLQSGWFSHVFNGTQARIWVSASQTNSNYSVKIDGGPFIPQSGSGYFESPILDDGQHTIVYGASAVDLFPAFDYLTVTAGSTTQLLGRTVIVDDAEITQYSGQWTTQPPTPLALSRPSAIYKNTTHWSRTVGDSFTLQFTGNSVAVYGVVPNNTDTANSTFSYSVDGVSTVVPVPLTSTQVDVMTEFFHADVPAGTHTLVFNVTEVAPSHVFGVDFVLYNSTVDTSSPEGSTVQTPVARHPNHTRIIVGATIGSIAALVLLCSLLCLYKRSKSRKPTASNWDVVTKAKQ
ncbi:hypothetical protein C8F04DRAFT_942736 [Mycena alexandri]|uniref:Transmembrane protein n=1 Tax=Mycena alexandri TaxID=1745969 RepID=A0AAD6XBT8_9AGAR|nr:hypothetical protein C8F04DRAFT_942736 [Mycena alexandri]